MPKEKISAKWKPINLKKFNAGIKKLRRQIGAKKLEKYYAKKKKKN